MSNVVLGKIDYAEYGTYPDRPFLFGLQLGFLMLGSGVMDGAIYTVNISKECKWNHMGEKSQAFIDSMEFVAKILKDAKVNYISQLKGKPVEINLDGNCFKEFRILTEVL